MIAGTIEFDDININFEYNAQDGTVTYTVTDRLNGMTETLTVRHPDFFCALSIAMHNDGMPDWRRDYPAAERAIGEIRWIP